MTVDVLGDVSVEGGESTASVWTIISITYVEKAGIMGHIK
jgi:hypothetical protein